MAYGLDTALNGADAFETCEAVADRLGQRALVGKRVLITGATSGEVARRGVDCRSDEYEPTLA
jgi:hypothetical protein